MSLPSLQSADSKDSRRSEGVMLTVYAPFGSDKVLSTFPDGATSGIAEHPLLSNLLKVAQHGVHVSALVDLAGDQTYLIDIPAGDPAAMQVVSRWKQDMVSPHTLAGLLIHAAARAPRAALVLALEGHGAGFMPDLDPSKLTAQNVTGGGKYQWRVDAGRTNVYETATGDAALKQGAPILPVSCPTLPGDAGVLSTWGLGAALRMATEAGVPKLSAIHFDNCFNMSVEVLHTVAPYAEYATGYPNYNFFTAGQPYPGVFEKLRTQGAASAQELAKWFAEGNHDVLAAKKNHPTLGCSVRLARMHTITECIDDLADALLAALRSAPTGAARQAVVGKIRSAIIQAQQFDTPGASLELEAPDQLTDIYSLAETLMRFDFRPHPVHPACRALQDALQGIRVYGDNEIPWVGFAESPPPKWNFSSFKLAMNIFLPDPILSGLWDWRSPYYLDVNPDPSLPLVQPHIIEFVKVTDWVDFLIEYHREAPFIGLLPAEIPEFPVFNATFEPPRKIDDRCGDRHVPGYRHRHDSDDKSGQ